MTNDDKHKADTNHGLPPITLDGGKTVIKTGRVIRTLLGFGFFIRVLFFPSHNLVETALFIGVGLVLVDVQLFRAFMRKG